jgi:hypothetical protein
MNIKSLAGLVSPAVGIAGLLGGSGKNPADAAMPYYNQIQSMGREQYNPYIQQGQQAGNASQGTYSQMAQDPMAFYNEIVGGYTPSKGYQYRADQARKTSRGAAASGGFAGTDRHRADETALIDSILSQGQNEYVNNILGIQGAGLQGQELGANRGFLANNALTDLLGGSLDAQGQLAYKGQANKNASKQELWKLLGQLGGAAVGSLGGPAGAVAGANIGGSLAGGGGNSGSMYQGYDNARQFGIGSGRF